MKYCEKCTVKAAVNTKRCPLCQNRLTELGGGEGSIFPPVMTVYHQFGVFFKLLILGSVAAAVICVAINLMLPQSGMWSMFVVMGVACLWIALAFALRTRHNFLKNLVYQAIVISVLSVVWDWVTGWRGWSIDYVIPIICMVAMVLLAVIVKIKHMEISDYIIYMALFGIFGIIPIIFYLTGSLRILYPSLICVAQSIISLAALIIFEGENVRAELKRRLHL